MLTERTVEPCLSHTGAVWNSILPSMAGSEAPSDHLPTSVNPTR